MDIPFEERTFMENVTFPKPLQGIKLLLAEDYFDIRLLLSLRLQQLGAKVDVAGSGKEVLEKTAKHDYDVILMDIKMPELNGFETLSALRAKKYDRPIIAVTGYGMEEERKQILNASFDAYLAKPFNEEELIDLIRKFQKKIASP